VPGLRAVRTYDRCWTRSDIVAGVVLAAILGPPGLAYAELAGLPPVTGLYTEDFPCRWPNGAALL
jgi:MFS superfamily sulfate permease-like transporter